MDNLPVHAATILLLYAVLPVWILAGFADYLCHRATHIEATSGTPESFLHLVQFGVIAVPTVLALLVEINSTFFLLAVIAILLHHAVAFIDVRYANRTRSVIPLEQMIHSFLEILPITAVLLLAVLHWQDFLALGQAMPGLHPKSHPLPLWYVASAVAAAILLNAIPYMEELLRCLRASAMRRKGS
jgi:hypothetical protein